MSHIEKLYDLLGIKVGDKINIKLINGEQSMFNPYTVTMYGLLDKSNNYNNTNLIELILKEKTYEKLPEQIELTNDEKVILRNIDSRFKYIARDRDNSLYIYEYIPEEDMGVYVRSVGLSLHLNAFNYLFKNITFDSGVHKISDLLQ